MKKYISKFIDIELYSDIRNNGKHIDVLLFKIRVAKFYIEFGSTEIKRLNN